MNLMARGDTGRVICQKVWKYCHFVFGDAMTKTVLFLVANTYMPLHLELAMGALRIANRLDRDPYFSFSVVTPDNQPVYATTGQMLVPDQAAGDVHRADAIFVISGFNPEQSVTPLAVNLLRRLERTGAILGAVSTGAVLLNAAGLLHGRRVAIHWEYEAEFRAGSLNCTVLTKGVIEDGRIISCPGGLSVADLVLRFITQVLNASIAGRVAAVLYHGSMREEQAEARDPVARCEQIMYQTLAKPLSLAELSKASWTSSRTLNRLFLNRTNRTPMEHYRVLRLNHAQRQLKLGHSVGDACEMSGFRSLSNFSDAYRKYYGHPPSRDRP